MKVFACAARRQSAPGRPNMLGTLIKQCKMKGFLRVQRTEKSLPGTAEARNTDKDLMEMKGFASAARWKLAPMRPKKLGTL